MEPHPLHHTQLESLHTTRPHHMPASLTRTSWPKTILRNITTDPPPVDTVHWRERSPQGKIYFIPVSWKLDNCPAKLKLHPICLFMMKMVFIVFHECFLLVANFLPSSMCSVSQAQAPLRSSRAFSVYIEDDRDRERQSVSRFSAVPESRSFRSVALLMINTCLVFPWVFLSLINPWMMLDIFISPGPLQLPLNHPPKPPTHWEEDSVGHCQCMMMWTALVPRQAHMVWPAATEWSQVMITAMVSPSQRLNLNINTQVDMWGG